MTRKSLLIFFNAALGPALIMLTLIFLQSPEAKWVVVDADGKMPRWLAFLLSAAVFYSCIFQIWLAKILLEPALTKVFDKSRRRP